MILRRTPTHYLQTTTLSKTGNLEFTSNLSTFLRNGMGGQLMYFLNTVAPNFQIMGFMKILLINNQNIKL